MKKLERQNPELIQETEKLNDWLPGLTKESNVQCELLLNSWKIYTLFGKSISFKNFIGVNLWVLVVPKTGYDTTQFDQLF